MLPNPLILRKFKSITISFIIKFECLFLYQTDVHYYKYFTFNFSFIRISSISDSWNFQIIKVSVCLLICISLFFWVWLRKTTGFIHNLPIIIYFYKTENKFKNAYLMKYALWSSINFKIHLNDLKNTDALKIHFYLGEWIKFGGISVEVRIRKKVLYNTF